jgi:hypothetical protein
LQGLRRHDTRVAAHPVAPHDALPARLRYAGLHGRHGYADRRGRRGRRGLSHLLETGKWLKLKAQEQLAVLSKLESLSQTLSRKITEGYPKAQAADLKAAEKGPFDVASRACSDYISEAADAASNLLYLPADQVRADTPHWVERIVEKADLYAPARKRLREAMVALQARYGG